MNHMLKRIYNAQYRYSGIDRIDITVKGQDPDWKAFAPTWDMVKGVKTHSMSEIEYIERYNKILRTVPTHIWDRLLQMEEVTFVCFCPAKNFCHRNLLTRFIVDSLHGSIQYMGFRH